MKNLAYLLIASLVMVACGSSESKQDKGNTQKSSSGNLYEDDNLIVENLDNWNGKQGPNGFGFYTWAIESSGDIYKDIEDQYSENKEPVKEVEVDGLPALTKLKEYQQNETIKERVWLIWNGKSVIQFSVKAPINNFDDNEAMKLIKQVKIKHREAEVSLPEPKKQYAEKPDHFPEETVNQFADYWSTESVLSDSALQNVLAMNTYLNQVATGAVESNYDWENNKQTLLDSLALEYHLKDWAHFEHIVKACGGAVEPLIKLLVDLETIDKNSENYALTKDAVIQITNQTHVSVPDLHYVYNNWDKANEFLRALKTEYN